MSKIPIFLLLCAALVVAGKSKGHGGHSNGNNHSSSKQHNSEQSNSKENSSKHDSKQNSSSESSSNESCNCTSNNSEGSNSESSSKENSSKQDSEQDSEQNSSSESSSNESCNCTSSSSEGSSSEGSGSESGSSESGSNDSSTSTSCSSESGSSESGSSKSGSSESSTSTSSSSESSSSKSSSSESSSMDSSSEESSCSDVDTINRSIRDDFCDQPQFVTFVPLSDDVKLIDNICYTYFPLPDDSNTFVRYQSTVYCDGSNEVNTQIITQISNGVFRRADPFCTSTNYVFGYAGCDTYLVLACSNFGCSKSDSNMRYMYGVSSECRPMALSCLHKVEEVVEDNSLPEQDYYVYPMKLPNRCVNQQLCVVPPNPFYNRLHQAGQAQPSVAIV